MVNKTPNVPSKIPITMYIYTPLYFTHTIYTNTHRGNGQTRSVIISNNNFSILFTIEEEEVRRDILMESFSSISGLNFEETELCLSLPGKSRSVNSSGRKRGFQESSVDLTLGSSNSDDCYSRTSNGQSNNNDISNPVNKPPAKAQVVGWPPVKSARKNMMKSGSKFVKVAVDGAPYLRKVDLEMYGSYEELLSGLENMFSCLGICNIVKEKKLLDSANGMEYVPTYEDKDGDWMLVGDVPWKMFVESCKRIRLMKGSDQEISRASPNCSSTNEIY